MISRHLLAFCGWCRVRGLLCRTGCSALVLRSLSRSVCDGSTPPARRRHLLPSFARCPVVCAHAPHFAPVCRSRSCLIPARRLRAGCGFAAPGCVAQPPALSPIIRARVRIIAARANVKGSVASSPAIAALDISPVSLLGAKYRARNKYGTIPHIPKDRR